MLRRRPMKFYEITPAAINQLSLPGPFKKNGYLAETPKISSVSYVSFPTARKPLAL